MRLLKTHRIKKRIHPNKAPKHATMKLFIPVLCVFMLTTSRFGSPARDAAISLQKSFQNVYQQVSPSVVSIATEKVFQPQRKRRKHRPFPFFAPGHPSRIQRQKGLGSGIILSRDGYILTNAHVVQKMSRLTVKLNNKKTYPAKLIGLDSILDLAILKIQTKNKLTPVSIGNSTKVQVGDWAIAIGAPMGFEQSMTVGIISSISRSGLDASGVNYIQTDAAINRGNSGGPLLNIRGEVIGINRMIASHNGGSVGIGFTIPINRAMSVVEELKKNGKIRRSWIGVALGKITPGFRKRLHLKKALRGAIILRIFPHSPAQKSGLHRGDVILSVANQRITRPMDVISKIRSTKIGQRIIIKILRKKRIRKILLTTEERPR